MRRARPHLLSLLALLPALGACELLPDEPEPDEGVAPPALDASGGTGAAPSGGSPPGESNIALPTAGTGSGGATGGSGGGSGGGSIDTSVSTECAQTTVSAVDTTTTLPADIIILVDTSGSMGEEAAFVQDNLNEFSQQIIDSGVDARVILIAAPLEDLPQISPAISIGVCINAPLGSGSCPEDTLLPNYVHIPNYVGSNDALDVLIATFPDWQAHLRPEAVKSILVVTDDNAMSGGPRQGVGTPLLTDQELIAQFVERFEALDPGLLTPWTMNAVYSFTECPAAARVGSVYAELVALTGGVEGDLCLQDFRPVFDQLAEAVVTNAGSAIACEWEIPVAVDGQTFSTELVEVTRTSTGGVTQALTKVASEEDCVAGAWFFDDATNPTRILACKETCEVIQDDAEGKIDVSFDCEVVQGCAATGATSLGSSAGQSGGFAGAPGDSADGDTTSDDAAGSGGRGPAAEDIGCEWPLPKAGSGLLIDVEAVNVRYITQNGFGVLLGQVAASADCDSVSLGWYYDDLTRPTSIITCPSTCETLSHANVTEVEALFGCATKPADIVR